MIDYDLELQHHNDVLRRAYGIRASDRVLDAPRLQKLCKEAGETPAVLEGAREGAQRLCLSIWHNLVGRYLMAETLAQLKGQLEHLSTEDKIELAHFLLESLEPEEEGVEAAWDQEIARRVDEIRSGRASGTPAEELFAELRREYP